MKMQVVAIVGTKKSGKTTTTENLVRELTQRGYRVAAIKHVSEPDFTIDTPGKDTWRFALAGAKTIISAAANEVATIEKVTLENVPLETLLRKCRGNDIVLVEGLKRVVSKMRKIPKIVVVKSKDEAVNALEVYKPILAFTGPFNTASVGHVKIPYADALKAPEKLADIVEKKLLKKQGC